jgi:hypothetical protein
MRLKLRIPESIENARGRTRHAAIRGPIPNLRLPARKHWNEPEKETRGADIWRVRRVVVPRSWPAAAACRGRCFLAAADRL